MAAGLSLGMLAKKAEAAPETLTKFRKAYPISRWWDTAGGEELRAFHARAFEGRISKALNKGLPAKHYLSKSQRATYDKVVSSMGKTKAHPAYRGFGKLRGLGSALKGRGGALAAIGAGAAGLTGFALTGKEDKKEKLKKHGQATNVPLVTANVGSRMAVAKSPFKQKNPKTPGTMANPPKPKVSATKRWIYKTFMKD